MRSGRHVPRCACSLDSVLLMTFLDGESPETGKGFRSTIGTKSRFAARRATAASHAQAFEDHFSRAEAGQRRLGQV